MKRLHALIRRHKVTSWACAILDCDASSEGIACVLLLASTAMTLIAFAVTLT